MRRLLRRLIVFVGVLGVVMVLNVGVAFAHDNNAFPATNGPGDVKAPVGSAIGPFPPNPAATHPGAIHMSDNVGEFAIAHNPNCPLHWIAHP